MARKCKIQESIRRYLAGLERKARRRKKEKSGELFESIRYKPERERAIMGPDEARKSV